MSPWDMQAHVWLAMAIEVFILKLLGKQQIGKCLHEYEGSAEAWSRLFIDHMNQETLLQLALACYSTKCIMQKLKLKNQAIYI